MKRVTARAWRFLFPRRNDPLRHAYILPGLVWALVCVQCVFPAQDQAGARQQVRTEIPYRDGKVTLVSDFQERVTKTRYRATGHVLITFQDIVVTAEAAEYDEETREAFTTGQTRFSQKQQWLVCSRAELNLNTQTGAFYDASGYTDQQFLITGRTILKTGPDSYRVEDGSVTACAEKRPKWSFQAGTTNLRVDRTARLHHTVFRIKGVPVFYFPYMVVPMEKKVRSSGLIPFHTGNSTSKGRMYSQGYYQTLGNSADVTVRGDYYSLRGLGLSGIFRARPNPATRFSLEVFGIDDKLDQGGILLAVDGETRFRDDWRGVAQVNITSNFNFRQAFLDSFRSATVSQERAIAFLTRNHNSFSTNLAYQRDEVIFPVRSLVIRKVPSLEFFSLGTPIGGSPLVLDLRASLDGMSRLDSQIETPHLVQRLDIHPRLTLRIPSFKGFSIVPSAGVRETYYGAQLSDDSPTGVESQGMHRRYVDLNIELRTPVLEKDFSSSWLGDFRHVLEPYVTYRRIHGISNFDKTIRFDEEDAIADTNEVEYGIVNRFYADRKTDAGNMEKRELMTVGLVQKYYFDPTFGGAFKEGRLNSFYPLDTVSGFYQTGIMRNISPISAIVQISPQNGIHHDVRADYDTRLQRWRNGSLSTLWQQGRFVLSGTYFRALATEPGMMDSNHIQGQIGYGNPERGLSSSLTVSYNLRTSQWLNSQTRVNYIWNCCGIAAEFNQFDLGLRTESRFTFSFTLKGIGSFGNLKRPETLF